MEDTEGTGNATLSAEAYRKIKQLLLQQKIVAGQRLIYRDLTEQLRMSRTPIVNALVRLEREGFLTGEAYRGFQVRPIGAEETMDLWGIREALELYAIEPAILAATDEDLAALEARAEAHRAHMPRYFDSLKVLLDSEFHLAVARLAGNKLLVEQLRTGFEHQYLRYPLHRLDLARMTAAVDEHRILLERMRAADVPGAAELLRRHIRAGRDNIVAGLFGDEEQFAYGGGSAGRRAG